jgi:ATP-dependent exoDNAse (exonuclease V) alpha subunit
MAMGHLGLRESDLLTSKRNNDVILKPDIVGMRVVARESSPATKKVSGRVAKNEFGTLIEYNDRYAVVRLDIMDREVRIEDPFTYASMFDAGYASTVHKFQGSESTEILYFMKDGKIAREGSSASFYRSKELKYVGMSRAMNKLTTVIIDPAEPKARRVDSATINLTPLARAMMLF